MKLSTKRSFSQDEQATWSKILQEHEKHREKQIVPLFMKGLKTLGIQRQQIPDLELINQKLLAMTGWMGVYVEGLEDGPSFYSMLRERKFPVGNFIRDSQDLNYTPAPDIVHDLYGHLPFYIDHDYANFSQRFGELAMRFADQPKKFVQFERVFWFTVEFGLMKTSEGVRIFGAGIASSIGECQYALSGEPEVIPFDLDVIRKQDFRIDQMQKRLFLMDSPEQLYSCLPRLEKLVMGS